jgi:hypothetical protein
MQKLFATIQIGLFVFSLAASPGVHAQQKPIHTFKIPALKHVAVDRIGNLLLQVSDHELKSFDQDGKLIGSFKSKKAISQLDGWNGIRIAIFHASDQSITWLNESLDVVDTTLFDAAFVIEPLKISVMPDFSVLVIDEATASIKHIDVRRNILKSEINLPVADSINEIKEYQGFIFLKSGVHLYALNRIGKLIKTLEVPAASSFHFLGEELYYQKDAEVIFFDFLEGTQRSERVEADKVLYTQDRIFRIRNTEVAIFTKSDQ